MRINKFVALAVGISRRAADQAISNGEVLVNHTAPVVGQDIQASDVVTLKGEVVSIPAQTTTIMLNKPVGYVCSRNGQGSRTIYDLLPGELHNLKAVGRLDKDSSGLLLLTNDGELANKLTHPKYAKQKIYRVGLNKTLSDANKQAIENGVQLEDGESRLLLKGRNKVWQIVMTEGRNRQIRRTFEAVNLHVEKLHRTNFGPYSLGKLPNGKYEILN